MAWTGRATTFAGAWIIVAAAMAGLIVSIVNFFDANSGIAGEPGTLLVIASTAILAVLGWAMTGNGPRSAALGGFLTVSALLALAGTAFAGFLLHSQALFVLMLAGLGGWLLHVLRPRPAFA